MPKNKKWKVKVEATDYHDYDTTYDYETKAPTKRAAEEKAIDYEEDNSGEYTDREVDVAAHAKEIKRAKLKRLS